jgi:hypothetical protein
MEVGDEAPVAQHQDAIREVHHLVEAMRDEEHPGPVRRGPPHGGEQSADLVAVQGRRGLVEDKQPSGRSHPSRAHAIATIVPLRRRE